MRRALNSKPAALGHVGESGFTLVRYRPQRRPERKAAHALVEAARHAG